MEKKEKGIHKVTAEAGKRENGSAPETCLAPEACRTLEELFVSWKQAQELEPETFCLENTFPKSGGAVPVYESFKRSFTPDGFLGEPEQGKEPRADMAQTGGTPEVRDMKQSESRRARVLFVAKESNLLGDAAGGSRTESAGERNDTFWLREVLLAGKNGGYYCPKERESVGIPLTRSEKGAQARYKKVLEVVLKKLEDQVKNESRTECGDAGDHGVKSEAASWKNWSLADCAYLNLNKRGGYKNCDSRRLIGYVRYYQAYLQREIELLHPEYVVLMGNWKLGNGSGEERNCLLKTRKETGEEEVLELIRYALESDGTSSKHRIFQTEHPAGRISYEKRSLREIW